MDLITFSPFECFKWKCRKSWLNWVLTDNSFECLLFRCYTLVNGDAMLMLAASLKPWHTHTLCVRSEFSVILFSLVCRWNRETGRGRDRDRAEEKLKRNDSFAGSIPFLVSSCCSAQYLSFSPLALSLFLPVFFFGTTNDLCVCFQCSYVYGQCTHTKFEPTARNEAWVFIFYFVFLLLLILVVGGCLNRFQRTNVCCCWARFWFKF